MATKTKTKKKTTSKGSTSKKAPLKSGAKTAKNVQSKETKDAQNAIKLAAYENELTALLTSWMTQEFRDNLVDSVDILLNIELPKAISDEGLDRQETYSDFMVPVNESNIETIVKCLNTYIDYYEKYSAAEYDLKEEVEIRIEVFTLEPSKTTCTYILNEITADKDTIGGLATLGHLISFFNWYKRNGKLTDALQRLIIEEAYLNGMFYLIADSFVSTLENRGIKAFAKDTFTYKETVLTIIKRFETHSRLMPILKEALKVITES